MYRKLLLIFLLCACSLLLLTACDVGGSPAPTPTPVAAAPSGDSGTGSEDATALAASEPTAVPSPAGLDDASRTAIYQAVVVELVKPETSTLVYLSPLIAQGDQLDSPDENAPIPGDLLSSVQSAVPSRTFLTSDLSAVMDPAADNAPVQDGGVYLTLGPILNAGQDTNQVRVRASIYRNRVSAEGNLYTLQHDPSSSWKITNVTQEWNDHQ